MSQIHRAALGAFSILCFAFSPPALARDEKGWDDASNIAEGALLATAFGLPAAKGDWNGDLQALGSTAAAFAVSQGLKEAFPETRPDGNGRDSFPSGHASVAFAAAASLQNRYGWEVGVPAQLVAGFVGVARIQARRHFWYDVLAGAAIGEASGFLITSRQNGAVHVMPWGDAHGAGATLVARF